MLRVMVMLMLAGSLIMIPQLDVFAEDDLFQETEDDIYAILSVEPRNLETRGVITPNQPFPLPTTGEAYKKLLDDLNVTPARVEFKVNSAELTAQTKRTLQTYAKVLKERLPQVDVMVAGHADTSGSDAVNLRISLKRAQAVADFLIRRQGLEATRFIISGFGEMSPLEGIPSTDPRNRRVEFVRIQ